MEGLGGVGARISQYQRFTLVASLPQLGIKLNRAQKWHPKLLGGSLPTTFGKDINLVLAMRANKMTHILDDSKNIHLQLFEHLNRFAGVLQRHIGRGANHN